MQIDWNAFAPVSAVLGGALIGVAAVLFALVAGRIAGVSGIVEGLLRPAHGEIAWRSSAASSWPHRAVDPKLALGAAIFRAGWGIAGFCPGPSLVAPAPERRKRSGSSSRCWPEWPLSTWCQPPKPASKPVRFT